MSFLFYIIDGMKQTNNISVILGIVSRSNNYYTTIITLLAPMHVIYRKVLVGGGTYIPHPYDLTLSGHTLYITDQTKMAVVTLDVLNPRNTLSVIDQAADRKYVFQVDYVSTAKQATGNHCGLLN